MIGSPREVVIRQSFQGQTDRISPPQAIDPARVASKKNIMDTLRPLVGRKSGKFKQPFRAVDDPQHRRDRQRRIRRLVQSTDEARKVVAVGQIVVCPPAKIGGVGHGLHPEEVLHRRHRVRVARMPKPCVGPGDIRTDIARPVGRSIVGNEDFEVLEGLAAQAIKALGNELHAVIGWQSYANSSHLASPGNCIEVPIRAKNRTLPRSPPRRRTTVHRASSGACVVNVLEAIHAHGAKGIGAEKHLASRRGQLEAVA